MKIKWMFLLLLATTARAQTNTDGLQQPRPPYAYAVEEVRFNSGNLRLAGTFTRPQGAAKYPVVITITGSGPQDRDESRPHHKPFWVLADYLSNRGVAVLRFDDRGVGGSEGHYKQADLFDFAADVKAAIAYVRTRADVDTGAIGLLGHSEGAAIAQVVAADNPQVAFLVSASGPGLDGRAVSLQQQAILAGLLGLDSAATARQLHDNAIFFDILVHEKKEDSLLAKATAFLAQQYQDLSPEERGRDSEAKYTRNILKVQTTPEALSLLRFDPQQYLPRVHCPVLAIDGTEDLQLDATANLAAIKTGLEKGGNPRVTVQALKGLNHVLQECITCRPEEYISLQQTLAPQAMALIANWIHHTLDH